MSKGTSQNCCWQCPIPAASRHWLMPHRRHSNTSRYIWFSLLWGHASLPVSLDTHKILFMPSKSGASVSSSLVEVLQLNPVGLPSQIPWQFLLPLPDPQVENPDMGLRIFIIVVELLWYYCSLVYGLPTLQIWDLILLLLCPFYCLIVSSPLSLDMGIFFGRFPHPSVTGCSTASCNLSVLTGGSEHMSFYSTILNQSSLTFNTALTLL